MDNFVELGQQMQAVQLAEGYQGTGIDEDDWQGRSAELFGKGGRAEGRLQTSRVGLPREFGTGNPGLLRCGSKGQLASSVEIEDSVDLDLPQAPLEELDQKVLMERLKLLRQRSRERQGQGLAGHV
jgi:hypothetical protein